jgi:hypothetical protein
VVAGTILVEVKAVVNFNQVVPKDGLKRLVL